MLSHSRASYPQWLEQHGMHCEWQAGGQLLVMSSEACAEHEFSTHAALRDLGIEVRALDGSGAALLEPCLRAGLAGAVHYPGDAQLRPESLLSELARVVWERGGRMEEGQRIAGFLRAGRRVTGVRTQRTEFLAEHVVLTTGAWSPELGRELGLCVPIEAARGYSITLAAQESGPSMPLILEEAAMGVTAWASGLRLGGSMEFAGMQLAPSPARFEALRSGARKFLRLDPDLALEEEWSGYRAMTPDELPMIGAVGRFSNLYLATGHGRMGVSMAPSTGLLIREAICAEPASLDPAPYSPQRFARNR